VLFGLIVSCKEGLFPEEACIDW